MTHNKLDHRFVVDSLSDLLEKRLEERSFSVSGLTPDTEEPTV